MATSGVADTIAKLQAFAGAITGVSSAPTASYPNAIDTARGVTVLTYAGPATTTALTLGPTHRRSVRTYYVVCYVEAIGQNTSNQRLQDALTLLQRFLDTFMTNRIIADGVRTIGEIQDTGISTGRDIVTSNDQYLTYNGQPYTGFVLEIQVIEVNQA